MLKLCRLTGGLHVRHNLQLWEPHWNLSAPKLKCLQKPSNSFDPPKKRTTHIQHPTSPEALRSPDSPWKALFPYARPLPRPPPSEEEDPPRGVRSRSSIGVSVAQKLPFFCFCWGVMVLEGMTFDEEMCIVSWSDSGLTAGFVVFRFCLSFVFA